MEASQSLLIFLTKPQYRIYRHLILLFLIATPIIAAEDSHRPLYVEIVIKTVIFLGTISVLYINMYWLIPRYLFESRYWAYGIGIAFSMLFVYGIIMLIGFVGNFDPSVPNTRSPGEHKFSLIFIIGFLNVGCSTTIKLFQRWIQDSVRINELEKLTMHSELEQLKSQINPHFLLNMLNNANVLIWKDQEKASQALMKLSDLLRYQLYDSTRSFVFLTSEIQFLTDLLNLESLRRDDFSSSITTNGSLVGVRVAPLLFVTFVENAVKHSLVENKPSFVNLSFSFEEGTLHFRCINSRPEKPAGLPGNRGGLGLANVRRRLEILYPDRHMLNLSEREDSFIVDLSILL